MRGGRIGVVFLGGGLGACARALLLQIVASPREGFPLGVLLANLFGSAALGVVFVLADEAELMRTTTRLFLAVGVLGGFTTFSTFGYGADDLFRHGHVTLATAYVVASVIGGLLAIAGGVEVGRGIVRLVERTPLPWAAGNEGLQASSPDGAMDAIETEHGDAAESA